MQVELSVTLLWSLANNLSFWVAALLTNSTLTMRKSKWQTFLGWLPFVILHFAVCAVSYSFNITDDNLNLLSLLVLVPAAAMVLYSDERAARVFTSVMGALIANVTTFFFCGTTLSFIDNTSNPYNMRTIGIFLCIKAFWFAVMFFAYRHSVSHIVQQVISVLGKQLKSYVPIPVYCFIAFAIVNRLTNTLGILPGLPDTRVYFIIFYLIMCSVFVILYYEIFSTALWSSRALKTEAELNVASNIQRDMLPNIFPAFPDRSEFDVYATMDPAKEVGGDFYDFFMIDQTHLAVVIADVSGKGVPAALFMVIAKTIIRNQAQSSLSPAEIFTRANEQLCENNGEGLFVTAYLGILDLRTGVLTYANAGHNPPLIQQSGGRFEWLKLRPGFVLAGMEGMRYKEFQVTLKPGDCLFLYTDGVTEATNAALELYGEKRLEAVLNSDAAQGLAPDQLLPYLKSQVDLFAAGAPQADDITMLGLQFRAYMPSQSKEEQS